MNHRFVEDGGAMCGRCGRPANDRVHENFNLTFVMGILRDHGFHESGCPVRIAQKYNDHGLMYMKPGTCNCWLSE